MHQHNDRQCTKEAIGGRHWGPVLIYACEVASANASPSACLWTKLAEDTYAGTEASWGTEKLNKNCGKKSFKGN